MMSVSNSNVKSNSQSKNIGLNASMRPPVDGMTGRLSADHPFYFYWYHAFNNIYKVVS